MRRVVCNAFAPPEELAFEEVALPEPGPGEVRVDVRASGVGYVDGLLVQGLYQVKPPLPYHPGSEFCGVISALGDDVTGLEPGQRVMGLAASGAWADALVIRASSLVPVPDDLDDATAAGFYINYATALYGLRDCGHVQAGECVLVLGAAGGVGSAAICVARSMGAHVIAGASTPAKREAALAFGAEAAVDYSSDDWRSELRALLPDGALNVVYDPVGGDLTETAFRSLSPRGRLLVVGFASGTIPRLPLNLPLLKRASVVGVDWGGDARANPHINEELLATLMQDVQSGALVPAAVTPHNLSDVRSVLTAQLAGEIVGKLVLLNDS